MLPTFMPVERLNHSRINLSPAGIPAENHPSFFHRFQNRSERNLKPRDEEIVHILSGNGCAPLIPNLR